MEKSGCFWLLSRNGDEDLVEELGRAFDHVEMTVGDGIEAARIDGAAHGK